MSPVKTQTSPQRSTPLVENRNLTISPVASKAISTRPSLLARARPYPTAQSNMPNAQHPIKLPRHIPPNIKTDSLHMLNRQELLAPQYTPSPCSVSPISVLGDKRPIMPALRPILHGTHTPINLYFPWRKKNNPERTYPQHHQHDTRWK